MVRQLTVDFNRVIDGALIRGEWPACSRRHRARRRLPSLSPPWRRCWGRSSRQSGFVEHESENGGDP